MKFSIIGVGWLGEQIADFLLAKGWNVGGTTTRLEKVESLARKGVDIHRLDLKESIIDPEFLDELSKSHMIIFTIPPNYFASTYAAYCIRFFEYLQEYVVEGRIIFISSISVYGNDARVVDEDSEVKPDSESAKQIVKVEDFIQKNFDNYSIWRLGGLVGPERHPINSLLTHKLIAKPFASVNLVHSKDVLNVLEYYITNELDFSIINICSPEHPKREEYYLKLAGQFNKRLPIFDFKDTRLGKIVESKCLKQVDFQYIYPSPFDYPQNTIV